MDECHVRADRNNTSPASQEKIPILPAPFSWSSNLQNRSFDPPSLLFMITIQEQYESLYSILLKKPLNFLNFSFLINTKERKSSLTWVLIMILYVCMKAKIRIKTPFWIYSRLKNPVCKTTEKPGNHFMQNYTGGHDRAHCIILALRHLLTSY